MSGTTEHSIHSEDRPREKSHTAYRKRDPSEAFPRRFHNASTYGAERARGQLGLRDPPTRRILQPGDLSQGPAR